MVKIYRNFYLNVQILKKVQKYYYIVCKSRIFWLAKINKNKKITKIIEKPKNLYQ